MKIREHDKKVLEAFCDWENDEWYLTRINDFLMSKEYKELEKKEEEKEKIVHFSNHWNE